MMKKLTVILLIGTLVFAACKRTQQNTESDDSSGWKFEKISIDRELFVNNDSTKGGMKLNLEFNYPTELKNDSILQLIQSSFVVAFAGEEYKSMQAEQAFDAFEKKAEMEGLELGNMAIDDGPDFGGYYKNVTTSVSDTTAISITARTETSDYTGGAHGSHQIFYYNIDIGNGKILNEDDIFTKGSKNQLVSLLQEEAKNAKNSVGEPITIFDFVTVSSNGNFYFNKDSIVYIYNQYEIAPYSDGIIRIPISYTKVKEMINPAYEALFHIEIKTE